MIRTRSLPAFPTFAPDAITMKTPPAIFTAETFVDGLDPGWSSPCVYLRTALLAPGWVHVCAEIVVTRTTISDVLEMADALPFPQASIVGCDHSVHTVEQTSGTSIARIIERTQRRVVAPYVRIEARLALLRGHLPCPRPRRRMTIAPECVVLLDSLGRYGGQRLRQNAWQCTTPRHGHSVDSLSYALLAVESVDRHPATADDPSVVSPQE